MKRIASLLLTLAMVVGLALPTLAVDRVQWRTGIQPPSNWLNTMEKNKEISIGQLIWDMMGRNNSGGFFTNLSVTPGTGLYFNVGPAGTNQLGAVYQVSPADLTAFGDGAGQIPADATLIFHQGLTNAATTYGPLTAPTGSFSVIDLIECQVQTVDTTQQTANFVSPTNVASSAQANRDRKDQVLCQAKLGTPATSPVVPTVDSGWVAIAQVNIPANATQLTSGMITMLPQFNGFLPAGSASTFMDLTSNQTAAGNKTFSGTTTFSNPIDFNNGAVTLSNLPQIAGDYQTNPGLLFNVASGSKGVQFTTNGALNGAYVNTSGTYYTGSTYLASNGANVAGPVTVNGATWDGLTMTASTGNGLIFNANTGAVSFNRGNGLNSGLKVWDGGTTNYGYVNSTGLSFSGTGTSTYTSTNAYVNGNIAGANLPVGQCLTVDSGHNIIGAGGGCGLSGGSITNVTGTAPITASVTGGVATVGISSTPTFAGPVTIGGAATTGQLNLGKDGNLNVNRSGGTVTWQGLNGVVPIINAAGGFQSGSSYYFPTYATVNGTITSTALFPTNSFVAGQSGQYGGNMAFGTGYGTTNWVYTGPTSSAVSGVVGEAFGININTIGYKLTVDHGGDVGIGGTLFAGSTRIAPTQAIINGNLIAQSGNSLPNISDNNTAATYIGSGYHMAFGALNTQNGLLAYGCTASSTKPCLLVSGGDTIAGVASNVLESGYVGKGLFGIDGYGNVGAYGSFNANGGFATPNGSLGGITLGNQGTATSSANYTSNVLQFNNSQWNGSAPVTNYWSMIMGAGGNFNIDNDGTLAFALTPTNVLTFNNSTLAAAIDSYTGGTAPGFIFNAVGGTTGDLFDFQLSGANKVQVTNGGNVVSTAGGQFQTGSSYLAATALNVNGNGTINGTVTDNGETANGTVNLSSTGTATSSTNYASQILQFNNSNWTGTAAQANNWQALMGGGNALNFLYDGTNYFSMGVGSIGLNNTSTNTISSNTTGANPAFILNTSNASAPTGDLLDVQLSGATKFQVGNGGFITAQGGATFAGVIRSKTSGADLVLTGDSSSGQTYLESANGGDSASVAMNLTGLNGAQGTLLNLNFATLNFSGATASSCLGADASKNVVSSSNCLHSLAVTGPITNSGTALDPNLGCSTCVTSVAASGPLSSSGGTAPTISCSTCITTAGGQTINGNLTLGGSGNFYIPAGDNIFGGSGQQELGAASGVTVQGVSGTLGGFAQQNTAWRVAIDLSGNMGVAGNLTATNFYNGSRREWKTDIHSIDSLDPFAILPKHWYTYRYNKAHGGHPTDPLKAGYMANDTNALLSGPHHDRYDLGNTLAITALATLNLNKRVKVLESRANLGAGGIVINGSTHDPRVDALITQVRLLWVLLGLVFLLFLATLGTIWYLVKKYV